MNEKKYEITNIAHPQYPWLHRIRALRDVREDVHAGDLGGFVQSEENLSQEASAGLRETLSWLKKPMCTETPSCGITPASVAVRPSPAQAGSVETPS